MTTDLIKTNEASQPTTQFLKIEREKRGISTKQIADVLNLPERFIIYLENSEFSKLPGITFTRGYIRNYAKYLELDNVEEIIAAFDSCVANDTNDARVLDFKQIKRIKSISNSIYWLVSFVVCLILAGVVFLIWQHFASSNISSSVSTEDKDSLVIIEPATTATINQTPNTLLETNGNVSLPLSVDNTAKPAAENIIPLSSTSNDSAVVDPINTSDKTEKNALNVQETAKPSLKKGEGLVEADFKANCWVSITDASGKVLVSKLFTANTHLSITGKAPLDVVLGAPSAVTMSYNGEPVKLNQTSNSSHRIKLGK